MIENAKLEPASTQSRPTKITVVTKLLSRSRGASVADIIAITTWQPHTVRAFLTGLRKKGVVLVREQRRDGETAYRINKIAPAAAPVVEAAGE